MSGSLILLEIYSWIRISAKNYIQGRLGGVPRILMVGSPNDQISTTNPHFHLNITQRLKLFQRPREFVKVHVSQLGLFPRLTLKWLQL